MPYQIVEQGGLYYVQNTVTKKKINGKGYPNRAKALTLQQALYANVPEARQAAATAPKPYGNVTYADPKNGKYPIDSEEHVRAAWSYINVAKNAAKYPLNGVTLDSVKSKIRGAMKRHGVKESAFAIMPTLMPSDVIPLDDLFDCPACDGGIAPDGSVCKDCAGTGQLLVHPDVITATAFVLEGQNGNMFLTGPATDVVSHFSEKAATNTDFMYLRGRYVEADSPNRNLAMWSSKDLQLGQPTVAGGPLNWLHEERHIIGAIMDSRLVGSRATAGDQIGTHIEVAAAIWPFIYPQEARAIEAASANRQCWLSMECVSREVQCLDTPGRPGCGETFPYEVTVGANSRACAHLMGRTSVRRFIDPRFLGGGVILPPKRPGWAHADATVMRHAAEQVERQAAAQEGLDEEEAREMVAAILQWSAA